jgi:transcriptional regulator with XRE-family HTH domain
LPHFSKLSFQWNSEFLLDKTHGIILNIKMTHSLLAQLLGRYISESRINQNIKQSHLANQLGFSRQFMNQVENGEVAIPKSVLIGCVNTLGLSPEKLKLIFRLASDQEIAELIEESTFTKNSSTPGDSKISSGKKSYG